MPPGHVLEPAGVGDVGVLQGQGVEFDGALFLALVGQKEGDAG
jgi:hypothetical protein